jgi:hypothetical protein
MVFMLLDLWYVSFGERAQIVTLMQFMSLSLSWFEQGRFCHQWEVRVESWMEWSMEELMGPMAGQLKRNSYLPHLHCHLNIIL